MLYCGPSPFWSGLGQVGSLQFGPPTNQQTHPTVLSHCQTATALILLLFCTLHLQQAVDISSLFHAHSHHSRRRLPPSICLTNASSYSCWGHVTPSHTVNHPQSDRSPAPRPPRQLCQLPTHRASARPARPVSCPRSIIHRHFGSKVPLLSIMGHLLDAKWSSVESAERICHLA